jgi:hypothetical protein
MTPQEKAIEIYNKFYGIPLYIKTIKQCCNIVIDEVIANIEPSVSMDVISARIKYWEQVKIEINNL